MANWHVTSHQHKRIDTKISRQMLLYYNDIHRFNCHESRQALSCCTGQVCTNYVCMLGWISVSLNHQTWRRWSLLYIFPEFFAAAPRNGVTGRPCWLLAPYGNFFLSAGFNIYADITNHSNNSYINCTPQTVEMCHVSAPPLQLTVWFVFVCLDVCHHISFQIATPPTVFPDSHKSRHI